MFGATCFAIYSEATDRPDDSLSILESIAFDFYLDAQHPEYDFIAEPTTEFYLSLLDGCKAETLITRALINKRYNESEVEAMNEFRFRGLKRPLVRR